MVKGIVFFDYDGTLVDERVGILEASKATKESIRKLQENGYTTFLATGRAYGYVPKAVEALHLDGAITCNGAFARYHGTKLYEDVFEKEELEKLLDHANQNGYNFMLENDDTCYVKDLEDPNFQHFMSNFHISYENFEEFQSIDACKPIGKLTLIAKSEEDKLALGSLYQEAYQVCLHRNCTTLDLGKKNMHKGYGVQRAAKCLNVDVKDTYAFGDGSNDYEMLDCVGCGIAMKVHAPILDEVCDRLTKSVEEEGITSMLQELKLID